jgi:hypothetical protein
MRKFLVPLVVLTLSLGLLAQTTAGEPLTPSDPDQVFGIGMSGAPASDPGISATVLFADRLSDKNLYSFSGIDMIPNDTQPGTVDTNVFTGLAQKVIDGGRWKMYAQVGGGVTTDGQNTGFNFNGGFIMPIRLNTKWDIAPAVRFSRVDVDGKVSYRPLLSLLFLYCKRQ